MESSRSDAPGEWRQRANGDMARFREGVFRIGPPQRSQRPRRLERWHFFVCTHAALASLCVDRSFVERTADAPRQRISFVASNTPAESLNCRRLRLGLPKSLQSDSHSRVAACPTRRDSAHSPIPGRPRAVFSWITNTLGGALKNAKMPLLDKC